MTQWAGGQHPLLTALRHNPRGPMLQAAAGRRMGASQQAAQMKVMADQQKAQRFQQMLGNLTQVLQQRQQQKWRSEEAQKERTAAQTRAETQAAARGERESFKTDARRFIREGGPEPSWLTPLKKEFGGDAIKAAWSVLGVEMPAGEGDAKRGAAYGMVNTIIKRREDGITPEDLASDVAALGENLRRNARHWDKTQIDALANELEFYVPGALGTLRGYYARGREILIGQPAGPTAVAPSAVAPPAGPVGRMAEGTPLEGAATMPNLWEQMPLAPMAGGRIMDSLVRMLNPFGAPNPYETGHRGPLRGGPPTSQPVDPNAPSSMPGELWDMFNPEIPFGASQPLMPTTQPVDPVQQMLDEILRNYSGPLSPRR